MELVGIDKNIKEIENFIINFNSISTTTLVLVGPPGCGKTSSVYHVAEKLSYGVCEYNMSDDRNEDFLKELEYKVRSKTLERLVFLLDEVDGISSKMWKTIDRIAFVTKNPLILTANNINKLSPLLRGRKDIDVIRVLKFYKPNLKDVINVVKRLSKEMGMKVNYTGIVNDFRQGIMTLYGSQGYKADRYWEVVEELLRTGKVDEIDTPRLILLLDNLSNFFSGIELFDAIQKVVLADRSRTHYPLIGLKSGRKRNVEKSYYFEKSKLKKQMRR